MQNGVAYTIGEASGIVWGIAIGGAAGARAALPKGVGREFSHAIPDRILKKAGAWMTDRFGELGKQAAGWLRKDFGRSKLNGNYVSPERHFKHDPFRYPKGWQEMGSRYGAPHKIWDRLPTAVKGAMAGGFIVGASAFLNEPNMVSCSYEGL